MKGRDLNGRGIWWRRFFKFVAKFVGLPVVGTGVVLFAWVGIDLLKQAINLRLEEVIVTGSQRLSQDQVMSWAGIRPGDNLLAINLREVETRLEGIPWVRKAVARSVPPGRVAIEIEERTPVAIIRLGDFFYLDKDGSVMGRVTEGEEVDYPVISGINKDYLSRRDEGSRRLIGEAVMLLMEARRLGFPPWEAVSEVNLEGTRGVRLFAPGWPEVRFGLGDYGDKLVRLQEVVSKSPDRFWGAGYVDLSFANQAVVGR